MVSTYNKILKADRRTVLKTFMKTVDDFFAGKITKKKFDDEMEIIEEWTKLNDVQEPILDHSQPKRTRPSYPLTKKK